MKPQRVKTGAVTDEQGRQRFHGAFTGGFSAGYFNTVGSAEGFTPATFHSSRSQRSAVQSRSARDYMDDEDGLLGGSLTAKKEVDSFHPANQKGGESSTDLEHSAEYSDRMRLLLSDLVAQPTNTMGKKLLGKLGWKPGQGIGPRRKMAWSEEVSKEQLLSQKLPAASLEEGFITMAPREEVQSLEFPPAKVDVAGIGYVNRDSLLTRSEGGEQHRYRVRDLFQGKASGPAGSKADYKRTGHQAKIAIGSMYLEEDEDIAFDDGVGEDFSFEAEEVMPFSDKKSSLQQDIDTYLQPDKTSNISTSTIRCPSDNKPPLPGFHVAKTAQLKLPHFPMPVVPKDFLPQHKFQTKTTPSAPQKEEVVTWKIDTVGVLDARAKRWQDESTADKTPSDQVSSSSVFNLLKPQDKERIMKLAANMNPAATNANEAAVEVPKEQNKAAPVEKVRPLLVNPAVLNSSFAALSDAFKNRFTKSTNGEGEQTNKDIVKEGIATAEEYSKLSAAASQTAQVTNKLATDHSITSSSKVVTRTTSIWEPSSLLCKRCNIKVPEVAKSAMLVTAGGSLESGKKKVEPILDRLLPQSTPSGSGGKDPKLDMNTVELKESNIEEDVFLKPSVATAIDNNVSSLSVFKSIFDDDSSSSGSEDEEDSDPEASQGDNGKVEKAEKESLNEDYSNQKAAQEPKDSFVDNANKAPTFVPRSQRGTIASTSGLIGTVIGSSSGPKRSLKWGSISSKESKYPYTKTRTLVSAISSDESDHEMNDEKGEGKKKLSAEQEKEELHKLEAAANKLFDQDLVTSTQVNGKRNFDDLQAVSKLDDEDDEDNVAAERRRKMAANKRKKIFPSSLIKPVDISIPTDASESEPQATTEYISSTPTPIQHVVIAAEPPLSQLSDNTPGIRGLLPSSNILSNNNDLGNNEEDSSKYLEEDTMFQVLPSRNVLVPEKVQEIKEILIGKEPHSLVDSGEESDAEVVSSSSTDASSSSSSESESSSQRKKLKKKERSKKSHHHKAKKSKKSSKKSKKEKKDKHHKKSSKRSKH